LYFGVIYHTCIIVGRFLLRQLKTSEASKRQINANVTKQMPTFTNSLEVLEVHSGHLQQIEFYTLGPVTNVATRITASYKIFSEQLEVAELIKKVESPRSNRPLLYSAACGRRTQLNSASV
jgi:hypothetical protein